MKRWMVLSIVSLFLIVALACGGGGEPNGGDGGNGGGGGGGSTGVQIQVQNNTPDEICYVYISPSSADTWGSDQLGGEETIAAGASKTFDMASDTYDVRLENCNEVAVATDWEVAMDTTIEVGMGSNSVALLVDNQSGSDVYYIFISPETAEDWGNDWLGDKESILSGQQRIFYVSPGTYDMMVADSSQETLTEEYGVDLTSNLIWTLQGN